MIGIYVGGMRARKEMLSRQADHISQHPGIVHIRIDGSEVEHLPLLESSLEQIDLFGVGTLICIDDIFNKKEEQVALAKKIISSTHDILVYQNEIPKWLEPILDTADKKKVQLRTYNEESKDRYDYGSSFAIADAFIKGDKRLIWTEYIKSIRSGVAPEEIHGMLFWAIKSLWLSRILSEKDVLAVGVKANVRSKYLQFGKGWDMHAIAFVLDQLKIIYHDAHRGEGELEVLLEMLLLKLQTKA